MRNTFRTPMGRTPPVNIETTLSFGPMNHIFLPILQRQRCTLKTYTRVLIRKQGSNYTEPHGKSKMNRTQFPAGLSKYQETKFGPTPVSKGVKFY